jgi:hypothetical protein
MQCDLIGCSDPAVAALAFRDQPGHVHVCAPHERLDREWCDVTWSAPMPCPLRCATDPQPLFVATPPLLA